MEIADFITARLAEDEAMAKAAPGQNWGAFGDEDIAGASVYDEQWCLLYPNHYDHDNALSAKPGATGPMYIERARDQLVAHVARHDPARVLREVGAKRAMVQYCTDELDGDPEEEHASEYNEGFCAAGRAMATWVLRDLAATWSDHGDYRPEWAPGHHG